ncbi:MAG: Uma2 family endonuclease [bacterium]
MSEAAVGVHRPGEPHVPELEPGDRLTRVEFERRYHTMPDLKKAELIEGIVYMPSPTRFRRHGEPNRHLSAWLGVYQGATPGVRGADNVSIRLDMDNEPQPDGVLLVDPNCGGQVRITGDDYIEGGPELVAEVSSSSVSYDLGDKLQVFRRHGVREYIVWRVLDQEIDWFVSREGRFSRLPLNSNNSVYKSEAFPGLWLDATAIVQNDLARVLAVLQHGLESPEHAEFVKRLRR